MIQNMKRFLSALLMLGAAGVAQAQILITDPDFDQNNPINCANFDDGSVQNFYDSGNSGANYGDNENQVITICPDLSNLVGSKISITFATNVGFTWDVLAGDFVTVYDGPTTASPLLGTQVSPIQAAVLPFSLRRMVQVPEQVGVPTFLAEILFSLTIHTLKLTSTEINLMH
jgi:hypothetical protein